MQPAGRPAVRILLTADQNWIAAYRWCKCMVVPPGGGRVRNVSTGIAMGAISFLYFIPLFRSFHIEATPTTSVVSFGLLSLLFSRGLLLASFCSDRQPCSLCFSQIRCRVHVTVELVAPVTSVRAAAPSPLAAYRWHHAVLWYNAARFGLTRHRSAASYTATLPNAASWAHPYRLSARRG